MAEDTAPVVQIELTTTSATITTKHQASGSSRVEIVSPKQLFETISEAYKPFRVDSTPILPVTGKDYTAVRFWSSSQITHKTTVISEGSAGPRTLTTKLHRGNIEGTMLASLKALAIKFPSKVTLDPGPATGYVELKFTLNLPYMLLVTELVHAAQPGVSTLGKCTICFSDLPFASFDQRVYVGSLPNLHTPHGGPGSNICWGTVFGEDHNMTLANVGTLAPMFYNSAFNSDLCGLEWYREFLPLLLERDKVDEAAFREIKEALSTESGRRGSYFYAAGSLSKLLEGVSNE